MTSILVVGSERVKILTNQTENKRDGMHLNTFTANYEYTRHIVPMKSRITLLCSVIRLFIGNIFIFFSFNKWKILNEKGRVNKLNFDGSVFVTPHLDNIFSLWNAKFSWQHTSS